MTRPRPLALRPDRLGRALRRLRRSRQLRQYETADRAGISNAMLSAYERGDHLPSLVTLANLLYVLGATVTDVQRLMLACVQRVG